MYGGMTARIPDHGTTLEKIKPFTTITKQERATKVTLFKFQQEP